MQTFEQHMERVGWLHIKSIIRAKMCLIIANSYLMEAILHKASVLFIHGLKVKVRPLSYVYLDTVCLHVVIGYKWSRTVSLSWSFKESWPFQAHRALLSVAQTPPLSVRPSCLFGSCSLCKPKASTQRVGRLPVLTDLWKRSSQSVPENSKLDERTRLT